MTKRIGFLVSHPIQYYAPIFRQLAGRCDLTVFFAHRQTPEQQARAGFGVAFDWDVDLLSGYESRFLENVARQPSADRYGGCDTPGIADEIAAGKFDGFVVPGWALRSYWQAERACRRLGVPIMVRGDSQLASRRNFAIRLAKSVVFSHILRRFDGFLYVGQRNREYLQHYGVPSDRLFFSPHCVDNDAFASAGAAARAHADAPPPTTRRRRVLFVGKLIGRKRPADVLEAVAKLGDPNVEVAFAGAGELESDLRRLAAERGVHTCFMGFLNQSELPAAYVSADLLVLPSNGLETWGLVVNEAMACGIPAVVSDAVGCAPDLVDPGETGQRFGCGDIGGLCEAIRRVLTQNPEQTRRHLAAKMARYSPAEAAEAIVASTTTIAGDRQLL